MLIGLASKNAILIVEFANQLKRRGMTSEEAVVESAKIRLRPILMTSIAFILGILPLILAEGAGANSRRSLGTAVFGGMVVSTILNLYIVPTLYVLIKRLHRDKLSASATGAAPDIPAHINDADLEYLREQAAREVSLPAEEDRLSSAE